MSKIIGCGVEQAAGDSICGLSDFILQARESEAAPTAPSTEGPDFIMLTLRKEVRSQNTS